MYCDFYFFHLTYSLNIHHFFRYSTSFIALLVPFQYQWVFSSLYGCQVVSRLVEIIQRILVCRLVRSPTNIIERVIGFGNKNFISLLPVTLQTLYLFLFHFSTHVNTSINNFLFIGKSHRLRLSDQKRLQSHTIQYDSEAL